MSYTIKQLTSIKNLLKPEQCCSKYPNCNHRRRRRNSTTTSINPAIGGGSYDVNSVKRNSETLGTEFQRLQNQYYENFLIPQSLKLQNQDDMRDEGTFYPTSLQGIADQRIRTPAQIQRDPSLLKIMPALSTDFPPPVGIDTIPVNTPIRPPQYLGRIESIDSQPYIPVQKPAFVGGSFKPHNFNMSSTLMQKRGRPTKLEIETLQMQAKNSGITDELILKSASKKTLTDAISKQERTHGFFKAKK